MLYSIEATFECDRCGEKFVVEIDPAVKAPEEWSVFEVAEDAIRAKGDESIQDGRHLCDPCTTIVDREKNNG